MVESVCLARVEIFSYRISLVATSADEIGIG